MRQHNTIMTKYFASLADPLSFNHRACLAFIILIGFLLRWYSLYIGHAYTYFTIKDEISALQYAFGFMAGDPMTYYLGQPALNLGHIPGPLWAMFVAAIYKLGGNSIEGAIFIMVLLNSLVIFLVYRLARRMMAPGYALFSTLFYALAPWAIYYSAGLYNPMVLALLGVLLYLSLWQTLTMDNARAVFWVIVLAAAIPQFHMIGIFYYPAIILLLLLSPARINLRWLAAGMITGMLLYLPYLIGEIIHHWSNLRNVLHGTGKFSSGVLKIITIPIGMLTNHPGEWPGYTSAELINFANRWFGSYIVLLIINIVSLVLAVFFLGSLFRRTYRTLRSARFNLKKAFRDEPQRLFIGILLVIPLLLYVLTGKAYATRYSIMLFPILFLLPALYLATLRYGHFRRILQYSLAVMLICNVYLVLSFYADQNRKLTHSPQFMPAFYKLEALNNALRKYAGNNTRIEVDATGLLARDSKYRDITTNAVSRFIELEQATRFKHGQANRTEKFILVNSQARVPPKADIVYRDNGLIAYVK